MPAFNIVLYGKLKWEIELVCEFWTMNGCIFGEHSTSSSINWSCCKNVNKFLITSKYLKKICL